MFLKHYRAIQMAAMITSFHITSKFHPICAANVEFIKFTVLNASSWGANKLLSNLVLSISMALLQVLNAANKFVYQNQSLTCWLLFWHTCLFLFQGLWPKKLTNIQYGWYLSRCWNLLPNRHHILPLMWRLLVTSDLLSCIDYIVR